jgi:hypothetical protein
MLRVIDDFSKRTSTYAAILVYSGKRQISIAC